MYGSFGMHRHRRCRPAGARCEHDQGGDFGLIGKLIHTAVAAGVQAVKFHPIQLERLTSATEAVRVVKLDKFQISGYNLRMWLYFLSA